jgi:hypothetical protein
MPLRAQPDGPQYPDLHEMRALAFVYLRAALYVVNDRGGSQFSLVAHIRSAPNADSALAWLTCGRTFPATQECRFGAGRIDSARLAAIMLLIYG